MASNKRRKVEAVETKVSVPLPDEEELLFTGVNLGKPESLSASKIRSGSLGKTKRTASQKEQRKDAQPDPDDSNESDYEREGEIEVNTEARENGQIPSIPRPSAQFTSLKTAIKHGKDGSLRAKISGGERLVIAGQFKLIVKKGIITILGARLSSSPKVYRINAFCSHSLPVIRSSSSDCDEAEIQLDQYDSGLLGLGSLSPLFQNLGVDLQKNVLGEDLIGGKPAKNTFQVQFSRSASTSKNLKWPVVSPSEWNKALVASTSKNPQTTTQTTMLCGPKSSGKSTFATLLTNRLLTDPGSQKIGVAFLDLDPGQPEYSVPGQLTLVHIKEPNLAPPFCHPSTATSSNRVIHSHFVGTITPSGDSDLYRDCISDLLLRYRQLRKTSPGCPLIINTPGWVQGTGLELLVALVKSARPSEILYMSEDGPRDTVEALTRAAGKIPFTTLPSQAKDYMTRTAAHLRTMQTMSYFHLKQNHDTWDPAPLSSSPPLEIRYCGQDQGILGVMCLGEQPAPELLKDSIDGNIVAIVAIDNKATAKASDHKLTTPTVQSLKQVDDDENFISFGNINEKDPTSNPTAASNHDYAIIRTPEGLPYFDPNITTAFDPGTSHCIGLAIVRGIDVPRQRLQILTPTPPTTIQKLIQAGKQLILVSGKLDTPGWAYTEEVNKRALIARRKKRQAAGMVEYDESFAVDEERGGDEVLGKEFENAPWIQALRGDQGRGVANRVWRVRRDLGKSG